MAATSAETGALPTTLPECDAAISGALGELMSSYENISKISEYCKTAYQQEDRTEIYNRTKNYTSDAILNVAYHVYKLGIHFTQYILIQNAHLDHLSLAVDSLSDRLRVGHEMTGQTGFRPDTARTYQKQQKQVKLDPGSAELPPCTVGVPCWVRKPIDFEALGHLTSSGGAASSSSR